MKHDKIYTHDDDHFCTLRQAHCQKCGKLIMMPDDMCASRTCQDCRHEQWLLGHQRALDTVARWYLACLIISAALLVLLVIFSVWWRA